MSRNCDVTSVAVTYGSSARARASAGKSFGSKVTAFKVRAGERRDAHRHIPQRFLGARRGHDQRVAEAGERQRDERHFHPFRRDYDAVDGSRRETAQPGAEPVGARRQAGEHEPSRTVRHRIPGFTESAEQRDRHPRQHSARRVGDGASDPAGLRPGPRG